MMVKKKGYLGLKEVKQILAVTSDKGYYGHKEIKTILKMERCQR